MPARLPGFAELLPPPPPVEGGKILVADDSAANRALYREMLEGAGHAVLAVESGEQARAAARAERPDLLILDVRLPGASGEEICREIKSRPEHAFLPIVLVTAYEARRRACAASKPTPTSSCSRR
jgi:CheY-like chemotaxis protein